MHPTISYEVAQGALADLRHHAQRGARAHGARHAPARLNAGEAQGQALFASPLERSDAPGADVVAEAITATMLQFGTDGCTGRMAQEFGDHPETATERMRWVLSLLGRA